MEGGFDDFFSLNNQLATLGLSLKQIPGRDWKKFHININRNVGDGNCLFRALGDQLDGKVEEHAAHREAVVKYMRHHRFCFYEYCHTGIHKFAWQTRNMACTAKIPFCLMERGFGPELLCMNQVAHKCPTLRTL